MKHGERSLSLLLVALFTGGCAMQPPIADVKLVAEAFEQLNAASQPLFDDLALAEREQGRTVAVDRALSARESPKPGPCGGYPYVGNTDEQGNPDGPGVIDGFCVEDAPYYSEIIDPPGTRTFRRALAAVGDYTELLLILAEGRNIDEATAQLHTLAGNAGAALGSAGALVGAPQAAGIAPALNGLVTAFEPLIGRAAQRSNANELKRLVREESPKVEKVLEALGDGVPALFNTLAETPLARFNTVGLDNPEVAKVEIDRIEGYRVAVSNFVVLLDQYRSLLHDLVAAYDAPRGSVTLASLVERSGDLAARADAWRRTLANLRTGIR